MQLVGVQLRNTLSASTRTAEMRAQVRNSLVSLHDTFLGVNDLLEFVGNGIESLLEGLDLRIYTLGFLKSVSYTTRPGISWERYAR